MASAAFKYVPQTAATTFLPSILYKFLFYAPSLPPPSGVMHHLVWILKQLFRGGEDLAPLPIEYFLPDAMVLLGMCVAHW